jgi:hypothetical protein
MKSTSRPITIMVGLALLIALGVAGTAQAQDREKYIISATAGGINYVSGNVTVQRRDGYRPQGLTIKDNLQTGDSVTTGASGRVEVLLNPGSYMRVDENSEFEFADASLDNLRVQLIKGSAILEVTGADDVRMEIAINTPQTDVLIVRRGIYRFNILPNETTELSVRKGRALFGKSMSNEVKSGQKVLIRHNRFEVAKLDKKNQDTLDLWSKERAGSLAHANRSLQTRPLIAAFAAFNGRDFDGVSLTARYYGLGLWVYNPRLGGFSFIPLGARYWSSPYGYDYPTACGWAGSVWNGASGNQGNGGTSGNGTITSTGGNSGSNNGGNTTTTSTTQTISPPPAVERSQPSASASHIERAGGEVPNRNPDE